WNANVEAWLTVSGTDLARQYDVPGYYVRVAPPDIVAHAGATHANVPIRNRRDSSGLPGDEQIGTEFLYLVRAGLRRHDDPMILEQVWDADPIPARFLFPGRPSGSAMPLAWAHAEFVKLLVSRQIGHPFGRSRMVWQRYRGQRATAQRAFWWPHAPIGGFAAGARLAVALPQPAVVHWGRDGWLALADMPTSDTGLGFHVAELDTAGLRPGSWVDFTWRRRDDGAWAGRDVTVRVGASEPSGPIGAGH